MRTFSVVTKLTTCASSCAGVALSRRPQSRIPPDSGASSPATARSSVLFPVPLRPSNATSRPPPIAADVYKRQMLLGAAMLLVCDLCSKQLALPVNTLTALMGIPIVVWVVVRNKNIV